MRKFFILILFNNHSKNLLFLENYFFKKNILQKFIILKNKCDIVDPAFRLMRFPLDGELDFNLKNDFFIDYLKMTWSRHLFLFYS